MDWTVRGMAESYKILDDWYGLAANSDGKSVSGSVLQALTDDLNMPQAIAELHSLRNRTANGDHLGREELAASLRFLGLLRENLALWSARKQDSRKIDAGQVESLIASRSEARKAKDWAASDRIRDELAAMGVVLKDSKDGTTWEVAR